MSTTVTNQDTLINGRAVRDMFGVSKITLYRWQYGRDDERRKTPPLAGFPKPTVLNGRHYWRRPEIEAFIADQLRATPAP